MSVALTNARNAVYALLESALPDITQIRDVPLAEKLPWRREIEDFEAGNPSSLSTPYVTVEISSATKTTEYGITNHAWVAQLAVYYVTSEKDDAGVAKTIEELLGEVERAAQDVATELVDAEIDSFQIIGIPDIDCSSSMEVNETFLGNNHSMYASKITAEIIFGFEA